MMKCVKKQRCKNLIVSYLVGCILSIAFVICSDYNNFGSNEFKFGFYLFLICQIFIWEPLSIFMILLIHKMGMIPHILDNKWQCVLYAFFPSLLMLADAFFDNIWIEHFYVDSIFLLFLAYLSYYIVTLFIAIVHNVINR